MRHHVVEQLEAAHDLVAKLQLELLGVLSTVPSEVTKMSMADAVDSGYLCREIASMMNELRKALEAKQSIVGRTLALKSATMALSPDGDVDLKLVGEYATATPSIKSFPKFPEEGSADWVVMMKHFGCSDEQLKRNVLRPSWREVSEMLNQALSEGREASLPGVKMGHIEATVIFKTKRKER